MRPVPQSIEKQNIQIFQLHKRLLRDFTEVGQVGCRSETKSNDLGVSVFYRHRFKAGSKQFYRTIDRIQFNLCQPTVLVVGVEDIPEHGSQEFGSFRPRIERNFPSPMKAQRTQIINSQTVIGVGVSIENRIELADLLTDGLLTEIRSGVNEYSLTVIFHQHRGPGATVARIRRMAHGTVTADGGHTHRCTAA